MHNTQELLLLARDPAHDVKRLDILELDRRFYEAVEQIGAITVEQVAKQIDDEFWGIVKDVGDISCRDIESELDDLRIARRLRSH